MIEAMNTPVPANTVPVNTVPAKPTLDGIEDKWTRVWDKECVVQV
jgi:hypothetical protein